MITLKVPDGVWCEGCMFLDDDGDQWQFCNLFASKLSTAYHVKNEANLPKIHKYSDCPEDVSDD